MTLRNAMDLQSLYENTTTDKLVIHCSEEIDEETVYEVLPLQRVQPAKMNIKELVINIFSKPDGMSFVRHRIVVLFAIGDDTQSDASGTSRDSPVHASSAQWVFSPSDCEHTSTTPIYSGANEGQFRNHSHAHQRRDI